MSISAGINEESKTKMREVLERKKEEANDIRQNIAKHAKAIGDEIENLTPFWLNSYVTDRRKPRGLPRGMNSKIKNKFRKTTFSRFLFFINNKGYSINILHI